MEEAEKNDLAADRVRTNIWLKRIMHQEIEEIARRDGRSLSDVVREALRDFLVKDRRQSERKA